MRCVIISNDIVNKSSINQELERTFGDDNFKTIVLSEDKISYTNDSILELDFDMFTRVQHIRSEIKGQDVYLLLNGSSLHAVLAFRALLKYIPEITLLVYNKEERKHAKYKIRHPTDGNDCVCRV